MANTAGNESANILIVDDVPANLVILSEIIKELGYVPRPVTSVKQAQTAIEKKMPNLILLDISMPDITGFEYCAMLRADVKTRDIPIIFISALDSMDDKVKGFKLGAVDYIAKPFEKEEVTVRLQTHLKIYRMQQELESYNRRLHKMVNDQMLLVAEEQKNILHALANLIEAKEEDSGNHLQMIGTNCRLLAISLQFSLKYDKQITSSFIDEIELASQLHDLGFIAIRDEVQFKKEELTPEEWKEIQRHTVIGAQHLEDIYQQSSKNEFMRMAIDIARYHHENWDGSGYPEGLAGEDIPLAARIVRIVDAFDALNRDRCWRPAYTLQESLQLMKEGTGREYDPSIMEIFMKVQKQLKRDNSK
ncbi:MAG: response regulator [Clostridiaceae bacterium]|nr:response regulator [Clostridiaceae bacterium]